MKLQIKTGGAWRDVLEIDPVKLRQIQEATIILAQAIGTQDSKGLCFPEWRITAVNRAAPRSPKVVAVLDPALRGFEWRKR